MEVVSILVARAIFMFELDSLNPVGRKTPAENHQLLQTRYGFVNYPKSAADVTADKGAEFFSGRMGDIAIEKVTLFHNGIVVDTRSSTENSESVLLDILDQAQQILASKVIVTRKQFVSQFSFKSAMRFDNLNPVLTKIAKVVSEELSRGLRQPCIVEPSAVKVTTDLTQIRVSPALFTIERREETPFFENTYFASAPLRTGLHMELVEEFEKSIL
jgi:hypothetical protein